MKKSLRRGRTAGGGGRPLGGSMTVPGDKSISHRALILGALAEGTSRIRGLNAGADVEATGRIVASVGATRAEKNGEVEVHGFGREGLKEPAEVLDCGNSGTTLRTMLGVVAAGDGSFTFTGDDSLRRRPMLRVVAPLRQMGARIDGRDHGNLAPLVVRAGSLSGIDFESPVASAQVKTALLLAGLRADGRTSVTEPGASRDHTERMLAAAGVPIECAGHTVTVDGGHLPAPIDLTVPGDVSAAAFFVAGALLVEGSDLTITDVGLNPTRVGLLEVFRSMGGLVETVEETVTGGEPIGSIRAGAGALEGVRVAGEIVPRLIDEIPVLAVVATQAEGITEIADAGELRVKESDRIEALATGLTALGAKVEALPDGLVIEGPTPLRGGAVDSRGDHRIAMAFAIAGLLTEERVTVQGWSCVDTSFPGFLDALGSAMGR
ncbi:MAG TPA: 3-phosphoshikimate 1-carboxyvinyltransferase [Actinomycetota bacterium]|nr:3-phosphoshikimate 1-carboxyvinyltransferase [Actinomycetota bacterium]